MLAEIIRIFKRGSVMKKLAVLAVIAVLLSGCASLQKDQKYAALAEEQGFAYFFPSSIHVRGFSNLEEAYDFISTAQYKLRKSIRMNRAKGLSAKLLGPSLEDKNPVVVACFVSAAEATKPIDLSKATNDLEAKLQDRIAVSNVFVVFHEGKAVSISDFYLKDGFVYDSNKQPTNFNFNGNDYKTEYPIGWGIDKAFQYLTMGNN